MNEEIEAELNVAREALLESEQLQKVGLLRGAGSRIYFSIFHAASAALLAEGKRCGSHKETIATFGLEFAKTRRLDPKYHRYLIDAEDFREEADYVTTLPVSAERVAELITKAREFLSRIEGFLQGEWRQE
jgi:uncharacterized protein (UPF0332 family)